tara:strand:- start:53 stop:811 length:759 start_codon:yes stop_codon:yes gene_type:complete
MVLQAEGEIDFPLFIFANVGDDSEHPDTLTYFNEVHVPFAAKHGIELVEVKKTWKDGSQYSLLQNMDRLPKTIPIPGYLESGMPWRRACTASWKIETILKELKRRGATKDNPALSGIGISTDEIQRVRTNEPPTTASPQQLVYPLIDLGLSRQDCVDITERAGLPPAPRSACWFCPFHTTAYWHDLAEDRPDLFEAAVELEDDLSKRAEVAVGSKMRIGRKGPLRNIVAQGRLSFDLAPEGPEECDSGNCFT